MVQIPLALVEFHHDVPEVGVGDSLDHALTVDELVDQSSLVLSWIYVQALHPLLVLLGVAEGHKLRRLESTIVVRIELVP